MPMLGNTSPFHVDPNWENETSYTDALDDVYMYPTSLPVSIKNERDLFPDCSYTTLNPVMTSRDPLAQKKLPNSEEPDLLSWVTKHPGSWSSTEVLDWLYYVAQRLEVDFEKFKGEAFQTKTGEDLMRMSKEDFKSLLPHNGDKIYTVFAEVVNGADFKEPIYPNERPPCKLSTDYNPGYYGGYDTGFAGFPLQTGHSSSNESVAMINQHKYDFDPKDTFGDPKDEYTLHTMHQSERNMLMTPYADDSDIDSNNDVFDNTFGGYTNMRHSSLGMPLRPTCKPHQFPSFTPKARQRQSILSSNCSDDSSDVEAMPRIKGGNRGRKPGQTKGNHLWEFIRDLLKDDRYCGKLIKWEDRREGVFRFVQSEAVAGMWGRKKNNPQMTYEKLSRAMRYYYKRGILERVDGRRLVYKFGKNSHGWQI